MTTTRPNRPSHYSYILCYVLYGLLIALVVVVIFIIWRQAVLNLVLAINGRDETNTVIYFASMIGMGLIAFIVVISGEPYLRNGVARGLLVRRFARLAVPFIIAGVIGVLVNLWAVDSVTNPGWRFEHSVPGRLQTTEREAM